MHKKRVSIGQVRPIGARALKSAIDTLRPWLSGSCALDLFAGQGRFGIEALKEGADQVVFVEKTSATAKAISREISRWKDHASVECQDALRYLELAHKEGLKYDLVFADPPFPMWNNEFSNQLFTAVAKVAGAEAIFLVKHPDRVVLSPTQSQFKLWKSVRFGESQLIYFEYGQKDEGEI